jgi:hypothetical protein
VVYRLVMQVSCSGGSRFETGVKAAAHQYRRSEAPKRSARAAPSVSRLGLLQAITEAGVPPGLGGASPLPRIARGSGNKRAAAYGSGGELRLAVPKGRPRPRRSGHSGAAVR